MRSIVALFFVFGLCLGLERSELFKRTSDRIVGGFETTIEEIPWQISLQSNSYHRCGGSIISNKWILTAAHCTKGLAASSLTIRCGSSEQKRGGEIKTLKRAVEHSKYNGGTIDFDFSLLELSEPLNFTNQVQAVTLPKASLKIADGTPCLVSGWGNTHNSSESNEKLRAAVVPAANQNYCNTQYNGRITPRMICAGYKEGGKDSCQGDSGGPLTIEVNGEVQLVGVVSFGRGCAEPNYPGVYARVTAVRSWIKRQTGT